MPKSSRTAGEESERQAESAGGRIGGRTGLQRLQRQSSRQKLLAAAEQSFAEHSYAGTSVDDIVRRAGVNRSTFYRHFDGKFAVAKALFDRFWPRLFAEYERLSGDPGDRAFAAWVAQVVDFYRANRALFLTIGQIAALEPEGVEWEETIRREVIALWGERFPVFARASAAGAAEEDRVRARLFMLELEMCLFELAFHEGNYETGAVIKVMIEEFRRFTGQGSSSKGRKPAIA